MFLKQKCPIARVQGRVCQDVSQMPELWVKEKARYLEKAYLSEIVNSSSPLLYDGEDAPLQGEKFNFDLSVLAVVPLSLLWHIWHRRVSATKPAPRFTDLAGAV